MVLTVIDPCPTCGKSRGYLMESHPSKPGLGGLLRGEGEDPPMVRVAWLAALVVVFASALVAFTLAP